MKHLTPVLRDILGVWAPVFCLAAATAGCAGNTLDGVVQDVRGETLPGVAVAIKGTDFQAVTDGIGQYRLPAIPGKHILSFAKTGYTQGALELTVDQPRPITATTVSLWPLPEATGVFLFQDYRYTRADVVTPAPWRRKRDSEIVFGFKRGIDVSTANAQPMIVCYNKAMPIDAKLSRLDLVEVEPDIGQTATKAIRVWCAVEDIPAVSEAIDEPGQELRHLVLQNPLEPGAYAVHWGGLAQGSAREEQRVFCFRVIDPNAPPEAPPAPSAEKEAPKKDEMPVLPPETGEPAMDDEG